MGLSKRLNILESDLRDARSRLNDEVKANKRFRESFVACEVCGCFIDKKIAVEGEHFIANVEVPRMVYDHVYRGMVQHGTKTKEVISIPWYCKEHAPKSEAKEMK